MSYPAISLTTPTVGRHRRPQKRLQTVANPPSTRIRARTIRVCYFLSPFQCPLPVHPCPSVDSGLHAKQSYSILGWRETRGETVITARHAPPRETRPITRSGATLTLQQPRVSALGHLEYCTHAQAVAWERIVGCAVREPGDGEWREVHYDGEGIAEVLTSLRTTATLIIVWEECFDDASTRRDVARALRTVMCGRESIHPADIRTTHQNVQVVRDGRSSEVSRAIVIWDRVGGGLGLSKAVADNLGRYTQSLLEIARQPGQRSEQERLLREDTAAALHRWATSMAPHTLGPEHTPVITEYASTTFRSQLEARWAAYFDQRGIKWQYERRSGSAAGPPISGSCWTVPRPTPRSSP